MDHQGFAPIRNFGERIANNNATRYFTGTGTPYLPLPGLAHGFKPDGTPMGVREIRINGMLLPESEQRSYPLRINGSNPSTAAVLPQDFRVVNEPLYMLDYADDRTVVAIRRDFSNDGIWQKDANIAVTADWVDEAPVEPDAKAKK